MQVQQRLDTPYSKAQMMALVNDIPAYPTFVPHCQQGTILTQNEHGMRASLTLGYQVFQQTFTTQNTFTPQGIEIELVEGPFQFLHGHWHFTETPKGCTVHIEFHYQCQGWLQKIIEPLFQEILLKLAFAFEQQAKVRYG